MDITEALQGLKINNSRRRTPVFNHGSSECQYALAFPKHVIDYLITNPKTSKQWKKLIQTCKLWFDRNPVVVFSCLYFKHTYGGFHRAASRRYLEAIKFLNASYRLWVTKDLFLGNEALEFGKPLIPRFYKCEAQNVMLRIDLNFEEFLFFTSNVIDICIRSRIKNSDGKRVTFEKILECLPPSIETVEYHFDEEEDVTRETFEKLSEIENVQKLQKITLDGFISEYFDFDALFTFILKNKEISFEVRLFVNSDSDEYVTNVQNRAAKIENEDYGDRSRPSIHLNHRCLVNSDNCDMVQEAIRKHDKHLAWALFSHYRNF